MIRTRICITVECSDGELSLTWQGQIPFPLRGKDVLELHNQADEAFHLRIDECPVWNWKDSVLNCTCHLDISGSDRATNLGWLCSFSEVKEVVT